MPRRDDDSDLDPAPRRPRRRTRREPDNRAVVVIVCITFGLLFIAAVAVLGYVLLRGNPLQPAGSDLARLAGTWESTYRDPNGQVTMYKVKQIVGTTETVTWYRPDGTAFRVNRVQFELEQRGPDRVFRYFNGWATDGFGGAGQPFPSGEYVYMLDGDMWTEYEPTGGVIVWTRRK